MSAEARAMAPVRRGIDRLDRALMALLARRLWREMIEWGIAREEAAFATMGETA